MTDRTQFVGGSDMASILNVDYGCRLALWREKRGEPQDYPKIETAPMERGKFGEAAAAKWYARQTGRRIRKYACTFGDEAWQIAHIDRHIVSTPERDGPGVLEIKCPGWWEFRRLKRDGMQLGQIAQVQWYLCVTGWRWGSFCAFNLDAWTGVYFDVQRDEVLIGQLAREAQDFWRQVENGPMPEPLPEIDRRCTSCAWRTSCRGTALLDACKTEPDNGLVHLEGILPLVEAYREAATITREAEENKVACAANLKAALGKVTAAEVPGYRIYNRAYPVKEYVVRAHQKQTLRIYEV